MKVPKRVEAEELAPKKHRGRKPGGVRNFVRLALTYKPDLETGRLRDLAAKQFGYTYDIDRHFPQLVMKVRKELGIPAPKKEKNRKTG